MNTKALSKLKKSTSIWNMLRTHRGEQKEKSQGAEIRGIVVKQGLNQKTITVRAWWQTFDHRWSYFKKSGHSYQVHDEENFCRVGDIVVIKKCQKGGVGETKSYFVRNVIYQGPRPDLWDKLDPKVYSLAIEKLYQTKKDEQKLNPDEFRLKAMRENLKKIKGLGLFDESDIRSGK
jgi:ribosomal protein S17